MKPITVGRLNSGSVPTVSLREESGLLHLVNVQAPSGAAQQSWCSTTAS